MTAVNEPVANTGDMVAARTTFPPWCRPEGSGAASWVVGAAGG